MQRKYVNKKTHSSFHIYKFLNMGIQVKYVSSYAHSSFKKVKIN